MKNDFIRDKKGGSIGKERRIVEKTHNVPGPGSYRLPSMIANVPKYALLNR